MEERRYMERAIYLASRAEAHLIQTNPRVGAVLVHQDRIIGEGYHMKRGEGHAEVNCMASVRPVHRHLIPDSTMYVTLEPCAHQGRTPSCARMLVAEKVKRVVVGTLDPFPEVSGKGCEILREGGIEVEVGLMQEECRELAKVFLTNQVQKRPYITLKWAESADGFIDRLRSPQEDAAKLSTPFIQLLTHKMRGEHCGILIGKNTLLMDNPSLTNRLFPGLPSPQVFVLDRSKATASLVSDRERWHLLSDTDHLPRLMTWLLEQGVTSLLIEGGTQVHQSFIHAGLWDMIRREVSPITLGNGVPAPVLPHLLLPTYSEDIDGHLLYYYKDNRGVIL